MDKVNYDTTGCVFDIKRFAVHDGPGVRSLIFLKGCPLKCKWCSNPESQSLYPQIMYYQNKCIACGKCLKACPQNAILLDDKYGFIVDRNKCDVCGICIDVCYCSAREIIGEEYSVRDVLSVVNRDRMHYENSGGGVTLSGGEPLMQPEFTLELLKALKESSISTAVETAGYVKWEYIEKACPFIDLIFFDFKQIDDNKHKKYIGVSNQLILENLKKLDLDTNKKKLIVRIPFIPGVNNSNEDQARMYAYLSQFRSINRVEVIPYHRFGLSKYKGLGLEYKMENIDPVQKGSLQYLVDMGKKYGIHVHIDAK